jgi:hypothetical protein
MSAPFDTLQLARGFEAAGFPLDQASKMAEAVAQATIGADLATKRDLRELEQRLTIRLSAAMVVVAGLLFGALHYWPPTTAISPPPAPQHTSVVLAGEPFDWDRYHARQDACLEQDRIAAACVQGYCDELVLRQARRACSAFSGAGERNGARL